MATLLTTEELLVPLYEPYQIYPRYNIDITTNPSIPNVTYTKLYPPEANSFYVNSKTSQITFNKTQAGKTVYITYLRKETLDNSPIVENIQARVVKSYTDPDGSSIIGTFHVNMVTKHLFFYVEPYWMDLNKVVVVDDDGNVLIPDLNSLDFADKDHNHDGRYQPYSSILTNISNITSTYGFLKRNGDIWELHNVDLVDVNHTHDGRYLKVSDNAPSASKLLYSRNIAFSGDVEGSFQFDGTTNIDVNILIKDDSHNHVTSNIDGLDFILNNKSDITHQHDYSNTFQAKDPDLTAISNLPNSLYGYLKKTSQDTWEIDVNSYALYNHSHNYDNIFQPYSSELLAIGNLTGLFGNLRKVNENSWILDETDYSPVTHHHNASYSDINHIHSIANSSNNGFLSSTLFTKLSNIEENANNYIHPENHPATIITQDTIHRFVTDTNITYWNNKIDIANKNLPDGYAGLDSNRKLLDIVIPSIAINDVHTVSTESAMLALSTATQGDFCIRDDLSKTFVLSNNSPNLVASWKEFKSPGAPVVSVCGRIGSITLSKTDVGLMNVDNTSDLNKPISTATQTALNGKSNTTHNHDSNYSNISHNHDLAYSLLTHNHNLDNLADITINTKANKDLLYWDSTNSKWTHGNLSILNIQPAGAYLTGNQNITITGDATGSGTTSIALTLANSGVTAGTYNNNATQVRPIIVNAKGLVTGVGTAVTIAPAWSSITSKPTTLSGYGITDSQPLDADLTAIAEISATSGLLKKTAANTWSLDTNVYQNTNQKNIANGYLGLDSNGFVPTNFLNLPEIQTSFDNNYTLLSIDSTLVSRKGYIITNKGTYTLPASPEANTSIPIMINYSDISSTNKIIFARNNKTINNLSENLEITTNLIQAFILVYTGSTWKVYFKDINTIVLQAAITNYEVISANFQAIKNGQYACNTSTSSFTLTLPIPYENMKVSILDLNGTFATNNLIIGRNNYTINNLASDLICNTNNDSFSLIYISGSWRKVRS